ncbi:hypothetical protein AAMO2058_000460200 [Amorphochlora amoebiformis]|eukprot:1394528-Amorphochlora_amoeboformis.AAC.2
MEVHDIAYEHNHPAKRRRLMYKMAMAFSAGFIGVLVLFACFKTFVQQGEPELGLTTARAPVYAFSPAVAPMRVSTRDASWVADARLRKRDRQALKHRAYNRAIRSAVRTRTKKVLRSIEEANKAGFSSEEELSTQDQLMREAYKQIDKAVAKGVMKRNTGSRQKSRIATWRKKALITHGVYTPVEEVAVQEA